MWLVINLLELWLLGSSGLWLLRSLLLGRSDLRLLGSLPLGCSDHLLLAHVVQSLKKGLLSMSGGRSALQTKTTIKYIK
jgi:hypothetical protein